MNITIVYKGDPTEIPVVLSVAQVLSSIKCTVTLICGSIEPSVMATLADAGVVNIETFRRERKSGLIDKMHYWIGFRRFVLSKLDSYPSPNAIWIGSGDTALALFGVKFPAKTVLHLHELYDQNSVYKLLLKRVSRSASRIVCPEISRAAILKVWFEVNVPIYVLPNRPFRHPRTRSIVCDSNSRGTLEELIAGRKVLLYQGHVGSDRSFRKIARVAHDIRERWALIVMGKCHDDTLRVLKEDCPGLIYVPHIAAPGHLTITALAHVGIIRYDPISLNNMFCAPNKLWEYAGYGIPFIANRLVGLQNVLAEFKCGLCVDDVEGDILAALEAIDRDYLVYSHRATDLYESVDMMKIVRTIISE